MNYVRTLLRVIGIACTLVACAEEFDTTRRPHREASVGDHVYEVLCNRLAISENPHDVSGRSTRGLCEGTRTPGAGTSARLKTLHNNRARLVQALDATLGIDSTGKGAVATDPELAAAVRALLDQLLPLYDSRLMEKHNAALGDWMQLLSDTSVTQTLAAQSTRQWYNQSMVQDANGEFAVPTAALPMLLRFDQLTDLGTSFDKVFGDGTADAPIFAKWLAQTQTALRAYEPASASASASEFIRDYLLKADDKLGRDTQPLYSVLRDPNGDAQLVSQHAGVTPTFLRTAPFGDVSSADDSIYTRDAYGRLQGDGKLLYAYQDLNKTPLAAALRQMQQIMSQIAALNAQKTGSQASTSAEVADDGANVSILDAVDWLAEALHAAPSSSSLKGDATATNSLFSPSSVPFVQRLWEEQEADCASLIQLFANMIRRMDGSDLVDVKLAPNNKLTEDLSRVFDEMLARPGLLDRVAKALQDPATARLGPLLAKHMAATDNIDYDQEDLRSDKVIGQFVTPVDRSRGDVLGNESVFQRLLHLVHDARGLQIVNNERSMGYAPGELFKIDDAALFYLRSIVGNARMTMCGRSLEGYFFELANEDYDNYVTEDMPSEHEYGYKYFIEYVMGLKGLKPALATQAEIEYCESFDNLDDPDGAHTAYSYKVSAKAAARMLFVDPEKVGAWNEQQVGNEPDTSAFVVSHSPPTLYDEPMIDGVPFRQLHGKTLFAWELEDFHTAIAPLVKAFASATPDTQEGNEGLLLDLLNILHKHWSTPQSNRTQSQNEALPNYAAQTGLARFEPLMAFALDTPDNCGGGALDLLANVLRAFGGGGSDSASDDDEEEFIVDVDSEESAEPHDIGTPDVDSPSAAPALIPSPFTHKVASAAQQRPGTAVVGALLDAFSQLNEDKTAFANRELHDLVSGLLSYMDGHRAQLGKLLNGETSMPLQNRWLVSTLELTQTYNRADPAAGSLVQALLTHLVSDEQHPAVLNATASALYAAADAKVDWQPLTEALASALDYPNGALPLTLQVAAATHQADTAQALPRVMANLGRALPHPNNSKLIGETPIDVFIDVFAQVNRETPSDTRALSADDHGSILATLTHFIQDEKRGFVRLLQLIKHRHGNGN